MWSRSGESDGRKQLDARCLLQPLHRFVPLTPGLVRHRGDRPDQPTGRRRAPAPNRRAVFNGLSGRSPNAAWSIDTLQARNSSPLVGLEALRDLVAGPLPGLALVIWDGWDRSDPRVYAAIAGVVASPARELRGSGRGMAATYAAKDRSHTPLSTRARQSTIP